MLEVKNLSAAYGAAQAVRSVCFELAAGEVLAILGPNGAGKSTLSNTLAGLHHPSGGTIQLSGNDLSRARATTIVRSGLTLVPQGRRVFGSCTVAEHVRMSRLHARPGAVDLDELLGLFPKLHERWGIRARELSGGEQQMLAIARAVLLGPRVLVLDEPTEGLAPSIVSSVGSLIRLLRERGAATLLMEQPGPFPHSVADKVATMDRGELSAVQPVNDVAEERGVAL